MVHVACGVCEWTKLPIQAFQTGSVRSVEGWTSPEATQAALPPLPTCVDDADISEVLQFALTQQDTKEGPSWVQMHRDNEEPGDRDAATESVGPGNC